ncbi:hypothetical protein QFC20_002334 [Naganishia adeliensis]|uniref:Uncharacterized protein n=1 Tax=Naganishia adeliensis TaxID=92952 RepID=A0ACC2WL02_9TREE|nr:hypothetical protein QFC20_002334 [Naganishia adeliensis]
MDSDALFHVKQLFWQALYAAQSHLALHPPATSSALELLNSALSSNEPPASARAVKSFAEFLGASDDEKESKLEELRDSLLEYEGEEVNEDTREEERINEVEEAVTTLTEGCGKTDLECAALGIQLILSLDLRDIAQTTYQSAKVWGEDSLLIQIMEAWIGIKNGGRPLNQSYYLYEELYQQPSG